MILYLTRYLTLTLPIPSASKDGKNKIKNRKKIKKRIENKRLNLAAAMSEFGGSEAHAIIPAAFKPSSLLPIARHRQALLYLIDKYPVVIVVGQTGSGKTTQIPQYLHQAGWTRNGKAIACTQVRTYGVLLASHANCVFAFD